MAQPTQARTKSKAEQEAHQKALRRAEQANILAGVRPVLEQDEQLLAFARARVAGGWRGKLNVGPEAFLAPFTNVALTERRFVVQHVHHTNGRPSEMLPHSYALGTIARVTFTDIETFGGEPACRLVLHLENGLYVRLRLRGLLNFNSAKNMAELFDSLTVTRRRNPVSPTQSVCPHCTQILDMAYKFCPYCGTQQPETAANAGTPAVHTGITLASEQSEEQPASAVQETDFAYERGDRPAEFGTALPVPDMTLEDDLFVEVETTMPDEVSGMDTSTANGPTTGLDTGETAFGAVLETEESPETFMDAGLFTPGAAEAPMPGEAEEGEKGRSGEEAILNPQSTSDNSQSSLESSTDIDFGQYEAQEFVELPFNITPDAPSESLSEVTFDVAANADESEHRDETETFHQPAAVDEQQPTEPREIEAATEDAPAEEAPRATDETEPGNEAEPESAHAEAATPAENTHSGDHQP